MPQGVGKIHGNKIQIFCQLFAYLLFCISGAYNGVHFSFFHLYWFDKEQQKCFVNIFQRLHIFTSDNLQQQCNTILHHLSRN